eukprot:TRINITY_DN6378_c1_g1_i3.p1 TRINITY_DN6378_c1_g1~~TRINITY_DN6378_c1_g1_i3.p1  ORF type:complete len:416 (-),score=32.90 TRINITY_DN6378_c1_g1_i3:351-1598(-)
MKIMKFLAQLFRDLKRNVSKDNGGPLSSSVDVQEVRIQTIVEQSTSTEGSLCIAKTSTSSAGLPLSPFISPATTLPQLQQDENIVDQRIVQESNEQEEQNRSNNKQLVGIMQSERGLSLSVEKLSCHSINQLSIGQQGLDLDVDLYGDLSPPISDARLVGVGAYGKVYKCVYKQLRPVAVKVFNLEHQNPISSPENDSFYKELNIICRLKNKYIVECYGACLKSGNRAIVMEYVDYSLDTYIHRRNGHPLELKSIYNIVKEIAKALHFLHYNKIVHRDLHPMNVLITNEGHVKVGDFGISRILQTYTKSNMDTHTGGVTKYMAPELFDSRVVPKSDIYSLGVMAWELYTKQKPWKDYGYASIIREVLAGNRPPLPHDMPKDLQNIITKCCLQEHRNRPHAQKVVNLCRQAIARLS